MTKEISIRESFTWFMTTLGRYDHAHLKLSDDQLLNIILEELDIEAITFLHCNTVDRLIENNFIPEDLAASIEQLRNKTLVLTQEKRSIKDIRNNSDWNEVRELAEHIKRKIQTT